MTVTGICAIWYFFFYHRWWVLVLLPFRVDAGLAASVVDGVDSSLVLSIPKSDDSKSTSGGFFFFCWCIVCGEKCVASGVGSIWCHDIMMMMDPFGRMVLLSTAMLFFFSPSSSAAVLSTTVLVIQRLCCCCWCIETEDGGRRTTTVWWRACWYEKRNEKKKKTALYESESVESFGDDIFDRVHAWMLQRATCYT